MQAYPVAKANQAHTIKALARLMASCGTPEVTESDQGTHCTSATVQKWAENSNTEWRFHLPYNPTGAGLIERCKYSDPESCSEGTFTVLAGVDQEDL